MATTSSTADVSNGRYWGLSSGLNVDSIVSGLLTKEQAKINKANQQEQDLEWKQSAYQDIISKLNAFENAYLGIGGGSTSMASSNMYASYTASSDNTSLLTATANSEASGIAQTVSVVQSAATASLISNLKDGSDNPVGISQNTLTGSKSWDTAFANLPSGNQSITFTLDDVTKTITFNKADYSSGDALKTAFNTKLSEAFGAVNGTQKVTVTAGDGTTPIGFTTASGYSMLLTVAPISSGTNYDTATALGISIGQRNRLNVDKPISDLIGSPTGDMPFTINGVSINGLSGSSSMTTILSAINNSGAGVSASYDKTSDTVSIVANQSGAAGRIDISTASSDAEKLFSKLGISMTSSVNAGVTTYSASSTNQKDAIVDINGTKYTRASNKFTISGVAYSINGDPAKFTDKTANLSFTQDTSKLEAGIQNFMSAYNTLIAAIHTQIDTKPDSNYSPLSDTQKAQMTQTQIDTWNAKAQAGILYGDSTLNSICDTMSSFLYKSVKMSDGTNYSIYNMGITTSSDPKDYGKLVIETENQLKFESAIATNTSYVKQLFTNSSSSVSLLSLNGKTGDQSVRKTEEGLVARLDDIIKAATGNVYGIYGSLTQIAGTSTMNPTNNSLYKEIKEEKSIISELTKKMKTKKNKLYTEFQKLETYMAQANSQTSMLSSFGSSS